MPKLTKNTARVGWFGVLLACLLLPGFSGCGPKVRKQAKMVENAGVIDGTVAVASDQDGRVIVDLFRDRSGIFTLEQKVMLSSDGTFRFIVLPGPYGVAAFIDASQDGEFQRGEHGFFHLDPMIVTVQARETVTIAPMTISGDPPEMPDDLVVEETLGRKLSTKNIGKVLTLDDPIFTRENYSLGMWQPVRFLHEIGAGVFLLQPYHEDKLPVIFVHGIRGGPDDWAGVIEAMDSERFQPWVLYYPSGLRLSIVANYLVNAIEALRNLHEFDRFAVAAHSMGGLVTRSFVKQYVERYPDQAANLQFVMTVNSPMRGLKSARMGVNTSPVVVPSWRDIALESEFVEELLEWSWPSEVPYHLVFSFKEGSGGDGVVPLQSQIPWQLQEEAVRTYGFMNDHVGTLRDDSFLELFNQILEDSVETVN
jgi:pimeloyl-ACP methyl ester carboxylesterase